MTSGGYLKYWYIVNHFLEIIVIIFDVLIKE